MGMAVALNPKRDALELLEAEHRTIHRLLERYEQLDVCDEARVEAAEDIGRELTYHTILESEIVLPTIESVADSADARTALEVARLEIEMANALIERSEALLGDAVRLDALFRVLIPLVRRHLSAEQAHLFPVLGHAPFNSRRMAAQISEHRAALERAVDTSDDFDTDDIGASPTDCD
ncbi:hemerythrin domain-containing protein [Pararobbsia silviterrae]|uniref:Hemerythrin domain-containing protein n=1 Tax=Pararobbsia silviterrae TaxID=1792498 RepID=A0A494YGQ0_9BURK|nr:hemerythrin domain-containing protein [Pararobbsia silviterrae]RKP59207.1 hemerythrin domain-containing protein [Pararobbsia silviterrae]